MVQTQLVGRLDLDTDAVEAELAHAATKFAFSEAYSDYLCGGPWKSAMLWASGGATGTGLVTDYDHASRSAVTEFGERLPYLRQLVETNFNLANLNFARLAVMSNSVTVPHRDLLELNDIPEDTRTAHRVHVPLVTSGDAYFTQDNVVYRMRAGEVWFFDASRVHGAAALSPATRTHLIMDFSNAGGDGDLTRFPLRPTGTVPADRIVRRPELSDAERKDLLGLAAVIDPDNYRDVFSIVIRKHYRSDGGDNFVWDTLDEIGRQSQNEDVRAKIQELHRFFLMERSA